MANGGSGTASLVTAIVCSLIIGGISGYYTRYATEKPAQMAGSAPAGAPAGGRMGPGGGGFGGGGFGGGGQSSPAAALPRLVRNLALVERVQEKGLSAQQAQAILPVLKAIQSADKLPEKESEAKLQEIEKALTDSQKEVLQSLQPQRGSFGGGGGGMGSGGMGSGGMGGPGMMMGGGMMGGQPDPERPFASERNKRALEELIAALEKRAGSGGR